MSTHKCTPNYPTLKISPSPRHPPAAGVMQTMHAPHTVSPMPHVHTSKLFHTPAGLSPTPLHTRAGLSPTPKAGLSPMPLQTREDVGSHRVLSQAFPQGLQDVVKGRPGGDLPQARLRTDTMRAVIGARRRCTSMLRRSSGSGRLRRL